MGGPDDANVPAPSVPDDRLDGGERVEGSVDRLYGVEGADIRGHTVLYEDRRLREAVREATGSAVDQSWRFFFATRLAFRPPLAPGTRALVLPAVRTEATRSFLEDLRDRGVEDTDRGRDERIRTDDRERLRLRQVTGTLPTPGGDVPVEGWVCVRHTDDIYVVGGAYPRTSLARALGVDIGGTDGEGSGTEDLESPLARDPADYRDELFALVGAVN